jgi:hypothetical protein
MHLHSSMTPFPVLSYVHRIQLLHHKTKSIFKGKQEIYNGLTTRIKIIHHASNNNNVRHLNIKVMTLLHIRWILSFSQDHIMPTNSLYVLHHIQDYHLDRYYLHWVNVSKSKSIISHGIRRFVFDRIVSSLIQ